MATYEHTERIVEMEQNLDAALEVNSALTTALDNLEAHRNQIEKLGSYYGSAEWFTDMEAADRGDVSVKCGVLTEDSPYDAIGDLRQNALRMLEYATEILKAI